MTSVIVCTNSVATEQLGEQLGKTLRGGELIELRSDLGGGKTTLVRGIAHGAGSNDKVASPSFTISREYQAGQLTIHHYDFYRLHEAGLMAQELPEVLNDPQAVVIIEWADVVENVLPAERVVIEITATGDNERELNVTLPTKYTYLTINY